VAGYTITITPNDDQAGPLTTIHVETASGDTRITELTVRAADGDGLSPQQLPALNLAQLIAAIAPTAPTAIAATPQPTAPAPAEPETDASAPDEAPQAEAPAGRGRPPRAKKAARKAAAKKAPSRSRQAKADKGAAAQATSGRRAYRRMPAADEVLAAYREVGGTTALARHFGVPRHTATGWLRRLRSQGQLES